MASFLIEGGHPLSGTITPQGAKNEALEVICATLLTADEVVIRNIPDIRDVNNLILLLKDIGVKVDRRGRNEYAFRADDLDLGFLGSDEFVRKCSALRGSVLLIGPLLARFGKAVIATPGGDKIGRRRLDTHFLGFKALGAEFRHIEDRNVYEIGADRLKGCYMLLDEASVTGTANIIMAAVFARGTTTIYNAACEPYIQQLCHMLNRMGASISGIASNLLTIVGTDGLHGTVHDILPDMIEVGSFIGMAAMAGNGIRIKDVSLRNLGIIPEAFRRLGIKMGIEGDDIVIPKQSHYQIESFIDGTIMTLADAPWPGLTPDLLSVLIVVATQARGSVLFHQKMFESRLFFVDKLIDMGAQIILCDPHRAVVVGHDHHRRLRAGRMASPDIRAGIALLIAAMSACGTSRIDNIEQIDRGYEDIEVRLNNLGARIERIS
ncbi:MAG TPA: UDP-N-acetylglucosamine 1-carboxyvinyltransferase [Candidatus Prevotella intestinigallinarum]|nr:UDP-N-acetylglucosamine 1-carboxyvinyltransferase [Candidatus Prevotella intestinigallinarum]